MSGFTQLFLRVALAASFLSAVADRFGFWGTPGSTGVSWGNWENFVAYSNTLNFFVSPIIGDILAIVATVLEVVFALLLFIGYRIRQTAIASGFLLLLFALIMTISIGVKAPLDYSVWTGSAACFVLSTLRYYPMSIDQRDKT